MMPLLIKKQLNSKNKEISQQINNEFKIGPRKLNKIIKEIS